MRKKSFGMIVSIMIILTMMCGVLVACAKEAPKDVNKGNIESAIDDKSAMSDIVNGWLAANNWTEGDTLGWDTSIDYSSDVAGANNLCIRFNGGIDNSGNSVIDFAVINKSFADKVEFGLQMLGDKFNITIQGKSYTNNELGINDFGLALVANGSVSSAIQTALSLIPIIFNNAVTVNNIVSEHVSGEAAANGSIYDVNYDVTLDINKAVVGAIDLVSGLLTKYISAENIASIRDILDTALKGITVQFNVDVKDKILQVKTRVNEEKNEINYTYYFTDGSISADAFDLNATVSGANHDIKINGLKFLNKIPTIIEPVGATEVYLLKHEIKGSIESSNAAKKLISKYTYNINIEFSAEGLVKAIMNSISTKSAIPVMTALFEDQKGKMFVDISHKCADSEVGCNGHMTTKSDAPVTNFDGSLFSLAYDATNFGTSNIYGSVNIAALLPGDFMTTLGSLGLPAGVTPALIWNTALKPNLPVDASFVVNPKLISSYYAARTSKGNTETVADANAAYTEKATDIGTIIGELIKDIDFDALLKSLTTNLQDGILDIDGKSIRDLASKLITDSKLPVSTATIVNSIIDMIIGTEDGVNNIAIAAKYKNGATLPTDFNVKESFMNGKDFSHQGTGNSPSMKAPIGSEIAFDKTGEFVHVFGEKDKNYDLQAADGSPLPFSYEELMTGIDKTKIGKASRYVKGNYTDISGNEIKGSKMYIMDVLGLDKTITNKPQEITLVLTRGTGQGIYTILDNILPLLKMFDIIKEMPNISLPVATVKSTITLRTFKSEGWSQDHISEDLRLDTDKIYSFGDKVAIDQRYVRKYSGATQKSYNATISYEGTTHSVFTDPYNIIEGATVAFYNDVLVKYSTVGLAGEKFNTSVKVNSNASAEGTIEFNCYQTKAVDINPFTVINPKTGLGLGLSIQSFKIYIDAFKKANTGVTVVETSDSYSISFPETADTANYQFEAVGIRGDKVLFKFTVNVNAIVGYKAVFLHGAGGMGAAAENEGTTKLNASTEGNPFAADLADTFSFCGTGTGTVYADGTLKVSKTTAVPLAQILAYVKDSDGNWTLVADTSATSKVVQISKWAMGTKIKFAAIGEYKLTYQPLAANHPDVDGIAVSLDLVTVYTSVMNKAV